MLYASKPITIQFTDQKGYRWVRIYWRSQFNGEWLVGHPIWSGAKKVTECPHSEDKVL